MLTNWGYSINAASLPSLLTIEEFNALTYNKYARDSRAQLMIDAVSASMRNYCGWHLASNIECEITYSFDDLHITRRYHGMLIQLPSRCATSIVSIKIDGNEISPAYFLKQNGMLKIYDCCFFKTITITFMSGLEDDAGLKALVAGRVSNVLSGVAGVSSESAGGVNISYSSSYVAGSNASTLLTADREFLLPYKIEELL